MKIKILLSAVLGVAAWSLSSVAAADWEEGGCPGTGDAPCIEVEADGDTYHFNGDGDHADEWHGMPAAAGGGDFAFSGDDVALDCPGVGISCTLSLSGEVKKCQDPSGAWRIGVRVNDAHFSSGDFVCSALDIGGFPWYSKNPDATAHCPFEDDCDSFIPYDANASNYTVNFGSVDIGSLLGTWVDSEHLHRVVFTPGMGASFNFSNRTFYNCDEEEGCSLDGILTLDNATSLDIH